MQLLDFSFRETIPGNYIHRVIREQADCKLLLNTTMAGTDDNKPTENEGENNSLETDDELNEIVREEYNQLDSKLDELNQALDMLEQKNDDIHSRLLELLQSNRDIREQLKHQHIENRNE